MVISRRRAIVSFASAAGLCHVARATSSPRRFLIVTGSKEGPHGAAIDGIQGAFSARSISAPLFRLPADEAALRQELSNGSNPLVIAVGVDAVRTMVSIGHSPTVATMAFQTDIGNLLAAKGKEFKLAGAVWLDLPISQVVAGLRLVFPEAAKLAVVRSPSQTDSCEAVSPARTLPAGVTLKCIDCAGASDLLSSMRKLRGQADFVICQPDSTLFNKTTVEPLILASLEHKLPLVGFSASFVRAGAALGVYPDFNELGHQAAALAERYLSNPSGVHEEHPRRTTVSVNERVLHILGRTYRPATGDEVVVIR